MRIIIEVRMDDCNSVKGQEAIRSFRLTLPDNARITWQGANPTKQYHQDHQVLRAYEGKNQILCIPRVVTWRRDDIQLEEFVQPAGDLQVVGRVWEEKGDSPLLDKLPGIIDLEAGGSGVANPGKRRPNGILHIEGEL